MSKIFNSMQIISAWYKDIFFDMIQHILKNLLLIGAYTCIDNTDIYTGMSLIRPYQICSLLYYFEGTGIFTKRSLHVVT